MPQAIGLLIAERIVAGAVQDAAVTGSLRSFPEDVEIVDALQGLPVEMIVEHAVEQLKQLNLPEAPDCIGIGIPGIVKHGTIEDSPNLVQLKGMNIQGLLEVAIRPLWDKMPSLSVFNDADVIAAGMAATRRQLDKLTRVWTLGNGIGYGLYPFREGVWEAGHSVISLDPKEQFCGCGGKGHLEGIMGHRSMRLRFMDLEPEEVFEQAAAGDTRCFEFMKLWHRALAAATATSIHSDGAGRFYVTGLNARFVNTSLLSEYLHEMVKLSPLQGYSIEVVQGGEQIAVIGAAVNARQSAGR